MLEGILGKDANCLGMPLKCLLIAGLLLYVLSPIDFLPELFLGPLGLIDDAFALILAFGLGSKDIFGKLGGMFK
jgi:uncharacterized membrane protein YkvA (DUF1232 family)